MNLLPYEHFTIHTYLSPEEVSRRLSNSIEPHQWLRWPLSGHKPYQGDLSGKIFNVTRIISYRNSFLPRISGTINSDLGQATIDIDMMLHPVVIVFMALWMLIVGLGFILAVVRVANSVLSPVETATSSDSGVVAGTALMLFFGWALAFGAFKFESVKSKRFFRKLLEDIGDR